MSDSTIAPVADTHSQTLMPAESAAPPPPETDRRPLFNGSYISFLGTQFLGAFNDNVFKQTVLLLCVVALNVGVTSFDHQAIVTALFALPFILFSGVAGDIADRYSKGRVIVWCKVAEIVVMAAGIFVFMMGVTELAIYALAALAFLMGAQSAFFGPPKYAAIPEMVKRGDIATASGITQMTTMFAIIFGTALAGVMVQNIGDALWLVGVACVVFAIFGTLTSLGIQRKAAADPTRRIGFASTVSVFPTLKHIVIHDSPLVVVGLAYSYFWLLGAWVLQVINAYGKLQLGFGEQTTSLLVATISLGIGVGSMISGTLSRGRVKLGICIPGIVLMVIALAGLGLLPVNPPPIGDSATVAAPPAEWVGTMAFVLLAILGASGGLFSVPLLAFIQTRPKDADKGRVIALMNFINWIFIFSASLVYLVVATATGNRGDTAFLVMAALTAIVGAVTMPLVMRANKRQPLPDAPPIATPNASANSNGEIDADAAPAG